MEQEYLKAISKTKGAKDAAVSLDYAKDLAEIVKKFNAVIDANPGTKAAHMAALNIGEIGLQYHKEDIVIDAVNKSRPGRDLLSAMALNEKATAHANKNECKTAVDIWNTLVNASFAAPLKGQMLLKQALCYESMNENAKAEENYNKIMAESKDGALGKTAEKYLRLLKSKI